MKALTLWQPWASLCVEPRSCPTCGGRGWHTAGGNDPMDCGRCDAGQLAPPFKSIETRSWKAPTSLIGQRIAIHAARGLPWAELCDVEDGLRVDDLNGPNEGVVNWTGPKTAPHSALWMMPGLPGIDLPLGAVVGTAVLAECVRMVHVADACAVQWGGPELPWPNLQLNGTTSACIVRADGEYTDVSDQIPFGDFRRGRWAWLLSDAIRFDQSVPCSGRQRVWNLPDDLAWLEARGAAAS